MMAIIEILFDCTLSLHLWPILYMQVVCANTLFYI